MFIFGGLLVVSGIYGAVADALMGARERLTREAALKIEGMFILVGAVLITVDHYVG